MSSQNRYFNVLPWNSKGLVKHPGNFLMDNSINFIFYNSRHTFIYRYILGSTTSVEPSVRSIKEIGIITSVHETSGHTYIMNSSGVLHKIVKPSNFKFELIGTLAFCNKVLKSYPLVIGCAAIVEYMDCLWLRIYNDPKIGEVATPDAIITSTFVHKLTSESKSNEYDRFLLHELDVSDMTKELKLKLLHKMNPFASHILILCDPNGRVYYMSPKHVNDGLLMICEFPTYVVCVSLVKKPDNDKHYGLCFLLSTGVVVILYVTLDNNAISNSLMYLPVNHIKACAVTKTGDILVSDGVDCYLCRISYENDKTILSNVMIVIKGISSMHLLENDIIHAVTNCGVSYVIKTNLINESEVYNRQLTIDRGKFYSIDKINKIYEQVSTFCKNTDKEKIIQKALSLASRGDYLKKNVKPTIAIYSECDLKFEDNNCNQHVIDLKISINEPSITFERNIFELVVKILKADKKEWTRKFVIKNEITRSNPLSISFRTEFTQLDLVNDKIPINCQFTLSPCGDDVPLVVMPLKTIYLDISYFYTPTHDATCKKSSSMVDLDACLSNIYGDASQNDVMMFKFSCPDQSIKFVHILEELFSNATHRYGSLFLNQFEDVENGSCYVRIQDSMVRIELCEGNEGKHFKVESDNKDLALAVKRNIISKIINKIEHVNVDGNVLPCIWKFERDVQIMRLQNKPAEDVILIVHNLGVQLFL